MQESNARKKLIVFLGIAIIALLGAVAAMAWALNSKMNQKAQQAIIQRKPLEAPKKTVEPKSTPYIIKANEIIAAAKSATSTDEQIIKAVEDFLVNFPEPKYDVESDKLQELLAIYIPLDEKRLAQPREEAKKAHDEELVKRQKADALAKEEQRKRDEAERQRKRLADEKTKQDKANQEQAERNLAEYSAVLDAEKDHIRTRLVELIARKDFKGLKEAFSMALNEPSLAISRPQPEQNVAKSFADWAAKLLASTDKAKKISDLLQDGTELAGVQLEIKAGTLGSISEIKDGAITAKLFDGSKDLVVSMEQLPFKQYLKLVKKAASKTGEEDAAFIYLLESGDFIAAKEISAPDEWKDESQRIMTEYIKFKLKAASTDAEKAELHHKYGRLDEYKDAVAALAAPSQK